MSATKDTNTIQAYSISGFCAAFSIGRSFLYDEVKSGNIRVTKVGRRTLIAADEAKRWFESFQSAA